MVTLPDLDRYRATRMALHAVAEHVLCAARYDAVGRIGLRASPGGFATPYFADSRRVGVRGVTIVAEMHGVERVRSLTTLRDAAAFVDVSPGAPTGVFTPSTSLDLDAPLSIDDRDAAVIADWFGLGFDVLNRWRSMNPLPDPSMVQLWPEHFDLACDLGDVDRRTRANYGFSPGDDAIPEPYLYIGPWDPDPPDGVFWNQPWGASLPRSAVLAGVRPGRTAETIALDFFAAGVGRLDRR